MTDGTSTGPTYSRAPMSNLPSSASALHTALTALLGHTPDQSQIQPGDRSLAKHLVLRDVKSWREPEVVAAADIAARHRHDLAAARVDFRRLPNAPPASVVAAARDALIDGTRRVALSYLRLRPDGYVVLAFPHESDLTAEARAIPGHERNPDGAGHLYPPTALSDVLAFARRHAIPVPDEMLAAVPDQTTTSMTGVKLAPVVRLRPDGDLEVVFPARTPLVYAVRTLPGRRWDPVARASVFPPRSAAVVLAFADAHGFIVDEPVRTMAIARHDQPQVTFDAASGELIVDCGYRPDLYTALREANDDASAFDRARSAYVLTDRTDAAQVLAVVEELGLNVEDAAQRQLTYWRREQQRNVAESVASSGPRRDVTGVALPLTPYQQVAVSFLLRNRRVLFADPPGSGQQAAALAAVHAAGEFPAIIVCPPSATRIWADLVAEVLPRRRSSVVASSGSRRMPEAADVLIVSAAALGLRATRQSGSRRAPRFLWLPVFLAHRPRALLIDDGHLEHAPRSGRARALYELAEAVANRSGMIVDLTAADPVRAGHHLLARQAMLLGRLADTGDATHLRDRVAADPEAVRRRLRALGMLLRRSPEALPAVPPAAITPIRLDPTECDQEALATYRVAEAAWLARRAEEVITIAARLRVAVTHPRVGRALRHDGAHQLAELRTLRRLLGQAKHAAAAAYIVRRRKVGEKLLLAAARRETVDELAAAFHALRIHSGRHADAVAAAVSRFHTDPDATVMTVALAEATVHDLTPACLGIQTELSFAAGELLRMLARMQRQGQTRPVAYEVLLMPATIDDYLWQALDLHGAEGEQGEPVVGESARYEAAAQAAWLMVCDALASSGKMDIRRPERNRGTDDRLGHCVPQALAEPLAVSD